MYCTTYDLATTGQRKLDKKLEIQNNFGLKTVQCIWFRNYPLRAATFGVKNNLQARFRWKTF